MSRFVGTALVAVVIAGANVGAIAQEFSLAFDTPEEVRGEAGSTVGIDAAAVLASSAASPGASGWLVAISAEGATVVSATTAGTVGAEATDGAPGMRDDGFESTEIIDAGGGVISRVILSESLPVTLPSDGTYDVLHLRLEADVPPPGRDEVGDFVCEPQVARLLFADGLIGAEGAANNSVFYGEGAEGAPTMSESEIRVCPQFEQIIGYSIDVLAPAGVRERVEDNIAYWTVPVPVSANTVDVTAGVRLHSKIDDPAADGIQGWSCSIVTDPSFFLLSATVQQTAGDEAPMGLRDGGFERTEIVDPTDPENAGREGAVTAVVLCFGCPITLPLQSEELVLRVTGEVDVSSITAPDQTIDPITVRPTSIDELGLRGSGIPVKTTATILGDTRTPDVQGLSFQLVGARQTVLLRGDANADGRVNIGDPIFIVHDLFLGGVPVECTDAGDANDDGFMDISDALYLINYRFRAGPAPRAPFPNCGADTSGDDLACPGSQARCL